MSTYRYEKPVLPQGWFMLVHEDGTDIGPFNDTMLDSSTLKGQPWALISVGSPVVLRLLSQEGDKLNLERRVPDGSWVSFPLYIKRIEKDGEGWKYASGD